MDPDDPTPPLVISLGNFPIMKPLYVDTTGYGTYVQPVGSQPSHDGTMDDEMDEPPLLSEIIGNSMRCLDTGNVLMFDMPELLPSSKQKMALPAADALERMPCLSPKQSRRRNRKRSSNLHNQRFLASVPLAQQGKSVNQVSWLKKDTEKGQRVVGELREKMLLYVMQDDLDIARADAIDKIQRRMVWKIGTAAPKALIAKLLYSLKRKRREAFKKQNEEIFKGLNWDFSSPELKTHVCDHYGDV